MLINLSNHPSARWCIKQTESAKRQFGYIVDLPFPSIDPKWTEQQVKILAKKFFSKVTLMLDECASNTYENAVHIQGEFTFVFALVSYLQQSKIKCIASTTTRIVEENENKKTATFQFVQFRQYLI